MNLSCLLIYGFNWSFVSVNQLVSPLDFINVEDSTYVPHDPEAILETCERPLRN